MTLSSRSSDAGQRAGNGDSSLAPAGSPPRTLRPRREDVRRRLLQAALAVFTERGYDRASLEQVAALAGFSKGAVYSNFASKDELFLALMDQQVRARIAYARETLQHPQESGLAGKVVGDRLTAALIEDRDWQLLFLDYVQRAVRDPSVRAEFTRHRRHVREMIADAIREFAGASDATSDSLDADELATTILALSNGLAIERFTDPAAVPEELLGRILQILHSAAAND